MPPLKCRAKNGFDQWIEINVFQPEYEAGEHVINHVLTAPESLYWALRIDISVLANPALTAELDALVKSLLARGRAYDWTLYQQYACVIQSTIDHIHEGDSYWRERNDKGNVKGKGIDGSGLYCVWTDDCVCTAEMPAYAAPKSKGGRRIWTGGPWPYPSNAPRGSAYTSCVQTLKQDSNVWRRIYLDNLHHVSLRYLAASAENRVTRPLPETFLDEAEQYARQTKSQPRREPR